MSRALRNLIHDAAVDWKNQAACAGYPDDLFFPASEAEERLTETALEVCASCQVTSECLDYALESNQRSGIWGGTTEKERRSLRRRWLAERKRTA